MSLHTSFRTGGPAEVFIKAESTENIIRAIDIAKKYNKQYIITGNGSNILVKDGGIDGIVINIGNEMSKICLLYTSGMSFQRSRTEDI